MWWLATTSAPRVTAIVLLSSAPTARMGRLAATDSGIGSGRQAAGAAQHLGAPARDRPDDGVVAADVDPAVVAEHAVHERRQAGERVVVLVGDGLVAEVAARHHERPAHASQQQVVQRRVRQQHAELRQPGGHAGGHRGARPGGARARSGGPGAVSAATAASVEHAEVPGGGEVGHHHREGLVVACLAPAQLGHRRVVARIDGQVEAADALHGDDPARPQGRRPPRVSASSPTVSSTSATSAVDVHRRRGPQSGQALGWAWKRRSVGSSYSAWHAAHITKSGHRRGRPVVGHRAHDRVAGTAVGAVRERVAVTTVAGVVAPRPGTPRRWRCRCSPAPLARPPASLSHDGEALVPLDRDRLRSSPLTTSASGGGSSTRSRASSRTAGSSPSTSISTPALSFCTQPAQAELGGVAVDERAEPHALHRARDSDPAANGCGGSHGRSADPGQRIAHEHVDDAGATERW